MARGRAGGCTYSDGGLGEALKAKPAAAGKGITAGFGVEFRRRKISTINSSGRMHLSDHGLTYMVSDRLEEGKMK